MNHFSPHTGCSWLSRGQQIFPQNSNPVLVFYLLAVSLKFLTTFTTIRNTSANVFSRAVSRLVKSQRGARPPASYWIHRTKCMNHFIFLVRLSMVSSIYFLEWTKSNSTLLMTKVIQICLIYVKLYPETMAGFVESYNAVGSYELKTHL